MTRDYVIPIWLVPTMLIIISLLGVVVMIYCKCKKYTSTRSSRDDNSTNEPSTEKLFMSNLPNSNYKPLYSMTRCRVLSPPPPMYDSVVLFKGINPSYTGPNKEVTSSNEQHEQPSSS